MANSKKSALVSVAAVSSSNEHNNVMAEGGDEFSDLDFSDPSFITYFSSCMQEVFKEGKDQFRTFGQRIDANINRLRSLNGERLANVEKFLTPLLNNPNRAELWRILLSPAGLSTLINLNDSDMLIAYCDIFCIDEHDIEFILQGEKDENGRPKFTMNKIPTIMGAGVWYKTMQELAVRGETPSAEAAKIMSVLEYYFVGTQEDGEPVSAAFSSGINVARRILSNVVIQKKRGRRPKNYADQYDGQTTENHDDEGVA